MSFKTVVVPFGRKFTSKNLNYYFEHYWSKAHDAETDVIIFDLQKLEWIALEEITFLFGWLRFLVLNDKKIKILLPEYHGGYRLQSSLKNLWGKWRIYSFFYDLIDQPAKLEDYFNITQEVNKIVDNQIKKEIFRQDDLDQDITVVPFQAISTHGYGNIRNIDDLIVNKIHKPLNLKKQVFDILSAHTNISDNDNLLLSKIVTNELFLNVLHHSLENNELSVEECYFAIAYRKKSSIANIIKSENFKRYSEKLNLGNPLDDLTNIVNSITEKEAADRLHYRLQITVPQSFNEEYDEETLEFFKNPLNEEYTFKNEPYIEFTFLDFGKGIPTTLGEFYNADLEDKEKRELVIDGMNEKAFLQNKDTQLLEYAFLMNSSREPLDLEFQLNYEIPRGLYFLLDVVRRNNGLVTARSRQGKVTFDFSKPVSTVKDSVRYYLEDHLLPDFKGTLISIVIPVEQTFSKQINSPQPSFFIPDKITQRNFHYYSINSIVNEILASLPDSKLGLSKMYNLILKKLDLIFYNHREHPALLIFDCGGTNIFPVKQKLLYYFSTSPNVNRLTSVIVVNFYDQDILTDVRASVKFRMQNEDSTVSIFKPLPIINSEDEIYWIGVVNEQDEILLTELLKYEDHFVTATELKGFKNYKGVFFDVDRQGNVTTKIPNLTRIIEFAKKYGKN